VKSRRLVVGVMLVGLAAIGCSSSAIAGSSHVTLTVLAASSLKNVFPKIGDQFTAAHPNVGFSFSFAGTDALTAQIEQGAPADVFAGSSKKYGDELSSKGLIDAFSPFCTNSLVLVVPPSNPAGIQTLTDLTKPGLKLVIGSETVPVGVYTRTVLTNLNAVYGSAFSDRVLANVVSNEDNVEGVLTKVESGEADAGFVYVTDSKAAGSAVAAIALPAGAQAVATYPIAVVKSSARAADAQAFVAFVLGPTGQGLLGDAGFGPPAG
jgi:molybdate transport system substrate-binding protein